MGVRATNVTEARNELNPSPMWCLQGGNELLPVTGHLGQQGANSETDPFQVGLCFEEMTFVTSHSCHEGLKVCQRVNAQSVVATMLVGRQSIHGIRPAPSVAWGQRLRRTATAFSRVTHPLLLKDTLSIRPLMCLIPVIKIRGSVGRRGGAFLKVVQ